MNRYYDHRLIRDIIVIQKHDIIYRIPEILNKRYRVVDVLATGGLGVLFIAHDIQLFNKKVLIKAPKYSPLLFSKPNNIQLKDKIGENRENGKRERTILYHGWARQIGNIPFIVDAFQDISVEIFGPHSDVDTGSEFWIDDIELYGKQEYIVLNYFSGKVVTDDISSKNTNLLGFVQQMALTISKILNKLHQKIEHNGSEYHFVYCDLKPNNILFTEEKQFVLIDLGSCEMLVDGRPNYGLTTTPEYCAPELKDLNPNTDPEEITPQADMFSLGMTLYEVLTDCKPEIISGVPAINADKINQFTANWQFFIRKCTEFLPQDRFESIDELIHFASELNSNSPSKNFGSKSKIVLNSIHVKQIQSSPFSLRNDWFFTNKLYLPSRFFEVWEVRRNKGYLQLPGYALVVSEQNVERHINQVKGDSIFFNSLLNNVLKNANEILCLNLSYMPELIDFFPANSFYILIYYYPHGKGLINKDISSNSIVNEMVLADKIKKMLYIMLDLKKHGVIPTSPNMKSIRYNSAGNLFFTDFFSMIQLHKYPEFFQNPLYQAFIEPELTAPEIYSRDVDALNDQTFSYLTGKIMLQILLYDRYFNQFKSNPFPEKKEIDKIVLSTPFSAHLKQLISMMLIPENRLRPLPYDIIQMLKDRSSLNKGDIILKPSIAKNLMLQISFDNRLFIRYNEIFSACSGKGFKFFNTTINFYLNSPSDKRLDYLNNKGIDYTIHNDINQLANAIDLKLKNYLINAKPDAILLIIDNSNEQIINVLEKHIKEFHSALIFSFNHILGSHKNAENYKLENYVN